MHKLSEKLELTNIKKNFNIIYKINQNMFEYLP